MEIQSITQPVQASDICSYHNTLAEFQVQFIPSHVFLFDYNHKTRFAFFCIDVRHIERSSFV